MTLRTLKSTLPTLNTTRIPTLEHKAGATPRTRGSAWMKVRHAVLLRDLYACQHPGCGHVSQSNQVDHTIPLEQGGTDAMANLKTMCPVHHEAKTKREATARSGR